MRDTTFAEFVGESLPALTQYAYALTGEAHAADDLVQDTLVKLAGAWRRVRSGGKPPTAATGRAGPRIPR